MLAGRLPGTVVSVSLLCLSPADFGRAQESTRDPHERSSGASGKVKGDELLPPSPGSLAVFAEAVTDKKLSRHHSNPVRRRGDAPSMKNRRHRGCISHCLHTQLSVAQWLARGTPSLGRDSSVQQPPPPRLILVPVSLALQLALPQTLCLQSGITSCPFPIQTPSALFSPQCIGASPHSHPHYV